MNDNLTTIGFIFFIICTTAVFGGAYCIAESFLRKLIAGEYLVKEKIRARLKKSDKLMNWLYSDENSLSEQICDEFCNAHLNPILSDWRDKNVNMRSMRK